MCPTSIIEKAIIYSNGRDGDVVSQNPSPVRVTYPAISDTLLHNPFAIEKKKKGKKKKKRMTTEGSLGMDDIS